MFYLLVRWAFPIGCLGFRVVPTYIISNLGQCVLEEELQISFQIPPHLESFWRTEWDSESFEIWRNQNPNQSSPNNLKSNDIQPNDHVWPEMRTNEWTKSVVVRVLEWFCEASCVFAIWGWRPASAICWSWCRAAACFFGM